MQRTPGAVRMAAFSFLAVMALQPLVAPAALATDKLSSVIPEATLAMSPQPHVRAHDKLTLTEQNIGGKTFHVGTFAVNATKEQVWNLLTDYESATSNFSYLKKCSRLGRNGESQLISFTAKTGVGPITIDYVLEIKESPVSGLIEWHRHSGAFKENEGYWKLESVDDGRRTLITYAKHVEAGFPFPPSMVAKAVKESMPVIFKDLNSSLERVAAGNPKQNRSASKTNGQL